MHTLDQLNVMSKDEIVATLDGVFEHAPWVAASAAAQRPFATVTALHDALMAVARSAPADVCLGFLRGHPPLSPTALADPALTPSSRSEQAGLAMAGLGDQLAGFEAASTAYEARFGFPFIVCVRRQTPQFVLRSLQQRLANTPEQERAAALAEIGHITRLRLVDRISGPGRPQTTGHLSTHVLDTGTWPRCRGHSDRAVAGRDADQGSRYQPRRPHRCTAADTPAAADRTIRVTLSCGRVSRRPAQSQRPAMVRCNPYSLWHCRARRPLSHSTPARHVDLHDLSWKLSLPQQSSSSIGGYCGGGLPTDARIFG